MAKVTDFKKLKQRQARRRAFKLAGLAGVILAIAYLFSSLVNSPEFAGLSSLGDMIKGGPGYPIDAPGGKIKGMYQNDSGIILLNETTLYIYNTSGSEVYSNLHRMGNPQVQTSGTMMLNYDRGSKTYAAYSRNNLFYNGSTDEAIRCGAISQNGCIAIATQTENAQTRVTVLDSRQREQYVWKTDNVVTALAMSDNGSAVAIASSYAQAGELKNVLTVLKNGQEQNRYELANQLILALEFDGSNVRCITDKNAFILGTEGKIIGQFDYKGQSLAAFAMYENGVALVFGDYEQDRKYTLASVADDFYTLNGTTTLNDSLQKVKAIGNTILVLGGSSFHEYSAYDCELLKEETNESYYDIQPMGNSIYAMTTTQIVRLPLEEPSRFALFSHKEPQQLPKVYSNVIGMAIDTDSISQALNSGAAQLTAALEQSVIGPAVRGALSVVIFSLCYLLLSGLVRLMTSAIHFVFHSPILLPIDRFFGAVMGFLQSCLNLYLICILFKLVFYLLGGMKYCNQQIILDTMILSRFYTFDPLALLASL